MSYNISSTNITTNNSMFGIGNNNNRSNNLENHKSSAPATPLTETNGTAGHHVSKNRSNRKQHQSLNQGFHNNNGFYNGASGDATINNTHYNGNGHHAVNHHQNGNQTHHNINNGSTTNQEWASTENNNGNSNIITYLQQLFNDKKILSTLMPNVFSQVERLLDDEIARVRTSAFHSTNGYTINDEELPEPEGEVVLMQDKVFIPADTNPQYNFVGRLLGPGGLTAKQLERDLGCKLMIRGKGSIRDKVKEEHHRGKPNWEHLEENLHVLINVEDTPNRAKLRLEKASNMIQNFFEDAIQTPEEKDMLKHMQLIELSTKNDIQKYINYASHFNASMTSPSLYQQQAHQQAPTNGNNSLLNTTVVPLSADPHAFYNGAVYISNPTHNFFHNNIATTGNNTPQTPNQSNFMDSDLLLGNILPAMKEIAANALSTYSTNNFNALTAGYNSMKNNFVNHAAHNINEIPIGILDNNSGTANGSQNANYILVGTFEEHSDEQRHSD